LGVFPSLSSLPLPCLSLLSLLLSSPNPARSLRVSQNPGRKRISDILRPGNVSGDNVLVPLMGTKNVVIEVNHAEFVLKNFKSPYRRGVIS